MGIKDDLVTAMQAYADGAGDLDFRVAWGEPDYRIEVRNETEDTGQGWEYDPNLPGAIFTAIAQVLGSWAKQDFDAVAAGYVTLSATPISAACLMVFKDGVLMRRRTSPSLPTEYSWTEGGKTISFPVALTGWISVYYLTPST